MKNFLSFIASIKVSSKPVLRQLYQISKNDTRTTTGYNLRHILLQTDKYDVDDLEPNIVENISYKPINSKDLWRVKLIKEIMDMKSGLVETPDEWTDEEFDEILNLACTE